MLRIFDFLKKRPYRETVTVRPIDQASGLPIDLDLLSSPVSDKSRSGNKQEQVIHLTRLETPLGTMYACGVKSGICLLEYADKEMLMEEFEQLRKSLNAQIIPGKSRHFNLLLRQLREYFKGKRREFSVPLVITGTEFQRTVWEELLKIPFGSTLSYTEQAAALKKPLAIRTIAHANSLNKLAILIPCHRVIGIDGDLRGYSGGHGRKKWLLDFEQNVRYGQSSLDNNLLFPE